ncbi:MAG: ATP-binding protein [Candidatus Micrarchaeota archaeon]|nr:ATP-binding protein [Candidatus Micrarchaeota archaeon]
MIIHRPEEVGRINNVRKWTLVFGRRKTGKTFLVENFVKYDEYFFVNRDRTVISKREGTQVGYDVFIDRLRRGIADGKTVAVDEFQRLGGPFLDLLHSIGSGGKVILLSSTLFLARRLISAGSPILGLFNEVQVPIISLEDSMQALAGFGLSKKELVEAAIMLREPMAAEYFDREGRIRATMADILLGSVNSIPALFGEILIEEDRGTSAIYEGVIRAVADGKVTSGEISSSLFSKRLISKDNPGFVQPYLNIMMQIGILKRVRVYSKNRFVYKCVSPLMRLFFYADEKYGVSQRQIGRAEAERILDEMLPRILEDNIREYLAYKLGLEENVVHSADYEIDGVLTRFKKPSVALEVKWKRKVTAAELREAEEKLGRIEAGRRVLFVQDKAGLTSRKLEIIDAYDLLGASP